MAEIYNMLQAPRHAELLRRLLGEDLELSSVSPEIATILGLEMDRPEWHFPAGSRLWATFVQVGANATHVSVVQFKVTASTNTLSTILGLRLNNPAAGGFVVTRGATRLGGGIGVPFRDLRILQGASGALTTVGDNTSFLTQPGIVLEAINVPAGDAGRDISFQTGPWVIPDGNFSNIAQLTVSSSAVNVPLNLVAWGYERPARPEEFAPT